MASGLQIRDGLGNVVLNTNDRITRFVARYPFAIGFNGTVGVDVPGWADDGTWSYFLTNLSCQVSRSGGHFEITARASGVSYCDLVVFRY